LAVLPKAKASARRIQCTSNLHQIGIGLRLYLDDFRRYPAFALSPFIRDRSNYWDARVLTYVSGSKAVFLCPGLTGVKASVSSNWNDQVWGAPGLWNHPNESYGYNTYGVGLMPSASGIGSLGLNTLVGVNSQGQPESSVLSPGDMIATADYDPNIDNDGDGDHPDCLFAYTLTGKHHRGKAVVAFCDAHVEYAKTNAWGAPAYIMLLSYHNSFRLRWNNDHQPHPYLQYFP